MPTDPFCYSINLYSYSLFHQCSTPLSDADTSGPFPGFLCDPFLIPGIHRTCTVFLAWKGLCCPPLVQGTYCRLMFPVISSINNAQCFLSTLPIMLDIFVCWSFQNTVCWSYIFHRISIQSVSFFHLRPVIESVPDQWIWSWQTLSPTHL